MMDSVQTEAFRAFFFSSLRNLGIEISSDDNATKEEIMQEINKCAACSEDESKLIDDTARLIECFQHTLFI